MSLRTAGIHHITAFARDPQKNVDFYAGVLGLRLVKKTVNFDAPEVYHLYFGDEAGNPGTIITFFPWPESRKGRVGGGQVGRTTFVIPAGAMVFWEDRLKNYRISITTADRFSEKYLQFTDPDGLPLELVEREEGKLSSWSFGGIPTSSAIKGLGGAVLFSVDAARTMDVLEHTLGLAKVGEDVGYVRYKAAGDIGNRIDVLANNVERGHGGAGTVHHIAWRAKDNTEHTAWQQAVTQGGYQPTDKLDRQYFHAIYFREAGGILFEIATDPPGFTRDEEPDALGERLMLPKWFEPRRTQLEANLQPLEVRVLGGD